MKIQTKSKDLKANQKLNPKIRGKENETKRKIWQQNVIAPK